ncbi:MAG: hypothetical protein ACFWUD_02875 [Thermocaproicibacter melissae]|jgi:cell wall-associated NlpC family hydrolase|uniref:C40 family peptidase n=1 Tax=Thermocaproicibacter melissae TaxID=2966552 RepID=UPI003A101F8D
MKRTKLLAVLAAIVMLASAPTALASASTAWTGTVRVSTSLNVRTAGNDGAPIIGKLYNGAKVTILDTVNGWYKISYNGRTAWISGKYVVTASKAQTVVAAARSQLGVAYQYGGATPYKALDCSGLTMYAYGQAGITLPHNAAMQSTKGWAVSKSALQPGDLVFFATDSTGKITHCGIYIGNGQFISAQSGAGVVKEASLSNSYWSRTYVTARRIIG